MPEKSCSRQLEKNRELLREKRKDEEKYQVVTGVMVFVSVIMVVLFLHGITTQDLSTGPGIFFVLRSMGYFVVLALPLLVWNVYRLNRYTSKRKRGADYYVYEEESGAESTGIYDMDDEEIANNIISDQKKGMLETALSSKDETPQNENDLSQILISQGMVEVVAGSNMARSR